MPVITEVLPEPRTLQLWLVLDEGMPHHIDLERVAEQSEFQALRDQGPVLYEACERQTAVIRRTKQGRAMTSTGDANPGLLSFLILGEVAAGQPTFTGEHIEGYAARPQDILNLHEGDFLLRVRGDSMIGVGIYPCDLVAIHSTTEEPHSGEITLVTVPSDDTATLKRWQRHNGTVSLHCENPNYPPMTYPVEDV